MPPPPPPPKRWRDAPSSSVYRPLGDWLMARLRSTSEQQRALATALAEALPAMLLEALVLRRQQQQQLSATLQRLLQALVNDIQPWPYTTGLVASAGAKNEGCQQQAGGVGGGGGGGGGNTNQALAQSEATRTRLLRHVMIGLQHLTTELHSRKRGSQQGPSAHPATAVPGALGVGVGVGVDVGVDVDVDVDAMLGGVLYPQEAWLKAICQGSMK